MSGTVIALISLQLATLGVLAGALLGLGARLGSRIDHQSERIDRLTERIGEVAERLTAIEARLDGIEARVSALEHPPG